MTDTLPDLHAAFIARIRDEVARDARLIALLAGGSYVHGGFDAHSDLDFIVLVDDQKYSEVLASRRRFAERIGELLAAFTGEHVGEPRLLICLYGPPLIHVDLKFATLADLDRCVERPSVLFARDPHKVNARLDSAAIAWPNATPDWFEQRAWIWLHYGATKLARGEIFEAIGMLAFFREQILGPMLHRRAGRPQRGVRRIETLEQHSLERLSNTVPACDAASVRNAFVAAAGMYLDLRNDAPPRETVGHMPQAVLSYLETAFCAATPPAQDRQARDPVA
ncbi:nucleotidyltransferase domain-containing protein [Pusillimonas noertemannii]|uniref:nucleotidyltransferase domain-containing protein n=1 Tax=Pusillimonas noertemannii TaxID=305977 RepID=UPI000318B2E7|nr:nucleotidyltransferase domain-containing protein [Pusillimonas noertemannii]